MPRARRRIEFTESALESSTGGHPLQWFHSPEMRETRQRASLGGFATGA
jgi:hypothetical protein